MKILKKSFGFLIIMLFIIFSCPLFACDVEENNIPDDDMDINPPSQEELEILSELEYEFQSQYTTEEHMQRIKDIMWNPNRSLIYSRMDIVKDIYVEVMYSYYTEDPEYFLIEVEYEEEFEAETSDDIGNEHSGRPNKAPYKTKFQHLVVRVTPTEKYQIMTVGFDQMVPYVYTLVNVPSVYRVRGYMDNKKYYVSYSGSCFGIQKDGNVYSILSGFDLNNVHLLAGLTPWDDERFKAYTSEKEVSKVLQAKMLVHSRKSIIGYDAMYI